MSGKKKKYINAPTAPQPQQVVNAPGIYDKSSRWPIIAILVLALLVFAKTVQSGLTFIDDDMYVLKNPYIREFSIKGIVAIFTSFYEFNYHPLTTLTYLVEYRFFGVEPLPYHTFNLLLHLLNTWLVYTLASRLSGKAFVGIVVSLLFAVHPMHVESVAWVSERKGLLCATFYLLALVQYVRYIDDGFDKKVFRYVFLAFLGALLSKAAGVTLPLLLLAVDSYRGRAITKQAIMEKVPLFLLSVLFGILAILSQKAGGAMNDIAAEYGILNRLFLFTTGLSFYFVKLVLPIGLSAIHYFPNVGSSGALPWYYYASVPFLLVLGWLATRKNNLKKEVLFGLLFFLVSISIMLQVITVGSALAAERYTYVSYIGLFYIAAQALDGLQGRWRSNLVAASGVVIVVFSALSWNRVSVWENTETVFADIIEKNKGNHNNYMVHFHWGKYLQWEERHQESIAQYDKALAIYPKYAPAYVRRGEAYELTGNVPMATKDYDEALRLDAKLATAYNNRGWLYFAQNQKDTAMSYFNKAIALDGKMAQAYNNRGWLRLQIGDTSLAKQDFDDAIKYAPAFAKPYYNRAVISLNANRIDKAINDYTSIININNNDGLAFYYRGICYYKLGNIKMARRDFERAAELGIADARSAIMELNGR